MRTKMSQLIAFLSILTFGCTRADEEAGGTSSAFDSISSSGTIEVSVARTSDEFSQKDLYVEITLTNLSLENVHVFLPASGWSIYVDQSSEIAAQQHTGNPVMVSTDWVVIDPGASASGYLGLRSLLDSESASDGWHRCNLYYDDEEPNSVSQDYVYAFESEVGYIDLPDIEVYVDDGIIEDWRIANP